MGTSEWVGRAGRSVAAVAWHRLLHAEHGGVIRRAVPIGRRLLRHRRARVGSRLYCARAARGSAPPGARAAPLAADHLYGDRTSRAGGIRRHCVLRLSRLLYGGWSACRWRGHGVFHFPLAASGESLLLHRFVLTLVPQMLRLDFSISWWAYIFPFSAAAAVTTRRYQAVGGVFVAECLAAGRVDRDGCAGYRGHLHDAGDTVRRHAV